MYASCSTIITRITRKDVLSNLGVADRCLVSERIVIYGNPRSFKGYQRRKSFSAVCRSCHYHIRDLRRIRHYLTFDSAKLLAHAFAFSRLDYCNSLLFGIADKEIVQLQRTQNLLARIVTKKPPLTRSAPLLRSRHRLPVKFRIEFKTCLLTYKTFNENQPDNLYAMLTPSVPSRSLRSNNGIKIFCP